MKTLFRPNFSVFHDERFQALIEKLLFTTYKIGAEYEEAPEYTDCVTATRHILENCSDIVLPRVYIGDMPKMLRNDGFKEVSLQEGGKWDIVFFEKMSLRHEAYMVAHMGILVNENDFFHSTLHFGGGKISSLRDIDYNSLILDESFLEIAKDPRSKK